MNKHELFISTLDILTKNVRRLFAKNKDIINWISTILMQIK